MPKSDKPPTSKISKYGENTGSSYIIIASPSGRAPPSGFLARRARPDRQRPHEDHMSYRMSYRVTDHTTLGVRRRVDARQAERAKEVAPGRRVREHV